MPKKLKKLKNKNPYVDKYGLNRDNENRIIKAFLILLHKYKSLYNKIKGQNKIVDCKNIIEYHAVFLESLRHDFLQLIDARHVFDPNYEDFNITKEYGFFPTTTIVDNIIEHFIWELSNKGSLIFSEPTRYNSISIEQKISRTLELLEMLSFNYKNFEEDVKKCLKKINYDKKI